MHPLGTNFKFALKDSEQNNKPEVRKEGTYRPKREATELATFRTRYAPSITKRGGSVKYSDTCQMYITKHMRTVNFNGYYDLVETLF